MLSKEDCKKEILWPLIVQFLSQEIRTKIAKELPLTKSEYEDFLRAERTFSVVSNALAKFPNSGTLSTNESIGKLLMEHEQRIKKHVSRKMKTPRRLLDYFAENIELSQDLEESEKRHVSVTGIKLKMRETACILIDEYNVIPVKAADAVFDYFKGKEGAYDNKLSFRTTVYKHFEITRNRKPEKKINSNRDMRQLRDIIHRLA